MSTISGNLAAGGAFSDIAFSDIAFNDIGFGGTAFSENAFSENGFGDGMRDASMPGRGMIDTDMTERLSQFLDVDVARYKLISSNLANIDTPGYRTRDLDFRAELRHAAARSFEMCGEIPPARSPMPPMRRWSVRCGGWWSVPTATTSAWSGKACCWPKAR